MANLLPKRTIANPATAAEIAITNRNVANIYKGLDYASYAIGGLGLLKGASLLHKAHKAYKARPVTIYRGIPDKKLSLKDAKKALTLNKYGFFFVSTTEISFSLYSSVTS